MRLEFITVNCLELRRTEIFFYPQPLISTIKLKTYSSLKSISFLLSISKYSVLNDFFLWCCSWDKIYLITVSNWERECENAPYPFCHSNLHFVNLIVLIHVLLEVFICSTISVINWFTWYPMNIWIWSGIVPIASNLCLWFWIIPVMYFSNPSFQSFFITASLFFNAKTRWIYNCVYVFTII